MVNPLAVLLAYLATDAALVAATGGRMAAKHKFAMDGASGGAWPTPSKALTAQMVSATEVDHYAGTLPFRVECRCYGASQAEALDVAGALLDVVEATERCTVEVGDDTTLLYYLVLDQAPALSYDGEPGIDMALVYLRASVATTLIG